jgi:hypothetical protein
MTTMTNLHLVHQYVKEVSENVWARWNYLTAQEAVNKMHQAISKVHLACGVPLTKGSRNKSLTDLGSFRCYSWELVVGAGPFDYDRISEDAFIKTAALFYHEGRHCEQYWHIARWYAMIHSTMDTYSDLHLTFSVARKARVKKMNIRSDAMRDNAKTWYGSIYGDRSGYRNFVYARTGLNRRHSHGVDLGDFHEGAWNSYAGSLPEERDAFATQKLVEDRFSAVGLPPVIPPKTGRPPATPPVSNPPIRRPRKKWD